MPGEGRFPDLLAEEVWARMLRSDRSLSLMVCLVHHGRPCELEEPCGPPLRDSENSWLVDLHLTARLKGPAKSHTRERERERDIDFSGVHPQHVGSWRFSREGSNKLSKGGSVLPPWRVPIQFASGGSSRAGERWTARPACLRYTGVSDGTGAGIGADVMAGEHRA